MDIVFVKGLKVQAVIGAYDWERTIRQDLVIDLQMSTDISTVAATDDLADVGVDYAAASTRVREFVEASSFKLIETLAGRLVDLLMTEFVLAWVQLTVTKPRPNDGFDAGLIVERGQRT